MPLPQSGFRRGLGPRYALAAALREAFSPAGAAPATRDPNPGHRREPSQSLGVDLLLKALPPHSRGGKEPQDGRLWMQGPWGELLGPASTLHPDSQNAREESTGTGTRTRRRMQTGRKGHLELETQSRGHCRALARLSFDCPRAVTLFSKT